MTAAHDHRLRITKVGLWCVLLFLVVVIAATNTGNNALYMVAAVMASLFVLSWLGALVNMVDLEVRLRPPDEAFASSPCRIDCEVRNTSRWLPRWLLQMEVGESAPGVIAHLPPRGRDDDGFQISRELFFRRRGLIATENVLFTSVFPLGFFRRTGRVAAGLDLVVYPEIFPAASLRVDQAASWGSTGSPNLGWGHDLHSLRFFREGDDPRGIHWKRTARTGTLVFTEREAEETRRLSLVLDNAVGELVDDQRRQRFEQLVSEAATAAVDFTDRGYEVELVTRDEHIPFGRGRRQRDALLTALALIEPTDDSDGSLSASGRSPELRLRMEGGGEVRRP